jgi:hypothetical protein
MMELPEFGEYVRDFPRLSDVVVELHLDGIQAMCLLGQIQLACRHVQNTGPTRRIVERIARKLQEAVSITPALAAVAEAGWHEEFDQEVEEV